MGAGTISDIFESHERGRAFAYYTCGPLLGPALGPIIGGYLNQGLGWRSNFWFLAIFCFMTWLGILFFLPETWRPAATATPVTPSDITLNEKTAVAASIDTTTATLNLETSSNTTKSSLSDLMKKKSRFVNPIGALNLLRYPNISLAVTFVGVL